jgi:hypothetical protein
LSEGVISKKAISQTSAEKVFPNHSSQAGRICRLFVTRELRANSIKPLESKSSGLINYLDGFNEWFARLVLLTSILFEPAPPLSAAAQRLGRAKKFRHVAAFLAIAVAGGSCAIRTSDLAWMHGEWVMLLATQSFTSVASTKPS